MLAVRLRRSIAAVRSRVGWLGELNSADSGCGARASSSCFDSAGTSSLWMLTRATELAVSGTRSAETRAAPGVLVEDEDAAQEAEVVYTMVVSSMWQKQPV